MDKVNLPVEKQSYASAVRGAAPMVSMFERREAARVHFGNQPKSIEVRSLTFRSVREGDGNLLDLLKEIKSRTGTIIDAAH